MQQPVGATGFTIPDPTNTDDTVRFLPRTVDELVRTQVKVIPNNSIISYPSSGTDYVDYSLRQLATFAYRVAQQYQHAFSPRQDSSEKARVVAIIGISELDYIVTMLALTKLGHSVLLMSPRLTKPAYAHLMNTTGSTCLVYNSIFRQKAVELEEEFPDLIAAQMSRLQEYGHAIEEADMDADTFMTPGLDLEREPRQVAWIFHSSGSTGMPKPIYITHKAALSNYRRDIDYLGQRVFLTLPVFHTHGISSAFRAFMSGKKIYIFNASLPLTTKSLIDSVQGREVEIFTTVPYALKILFESEEGIRFLQRFKFVNFGGAPCPDELGDRLTARGVKLVTVYGMGECGPLMTSWRPDGDTAWAYLRLSEHARKHLRFVDQGDCTYELVVSPGWPSLVAHNQSDGSYATRDLFVKHPTLKGAWKYCGRIDDVIVLENGEKANPLPIEGATRRHELVVEVVVVGVGKPHFGIVIILSRAAEGLSHDTILDKISPIIEESQQVLPTYAKISRDMVILLPAGTEYPRTDKGTVIRKAFYRQFEREIDERYLDGSVANTTTTTKVGSEEELHDLIRDTASIVLELGENSTLTDDDDFFALGMDSLQASQLRAVLVKNVYTKGQRLGMNVVFDNPSIGSLTRFIRNVQLGSTEGKEKIDVEVEQQMKYLIDKYGHFRKPELQSTPVEKSSAGTKVILTGATGSLGAHLLATLVRSVSVSTVYCLVRAGTDQKAAVRVLASLRERRICHTLSVQQRRKIVALSADLSQPRLGLSSESFDQIAKDVDKVYHCGWTVNFNWNLRSFEKDCIAGVRHLIDLCLRTSVPASSKKIAGAQFVFASSVGTVLRTKLPVVPETLPPDFSSTQPTGYAQSKLVAEHICQNAVTEAGLRVRVFRIGQVIGDTNRGVWSSTEAIPLMLQTAILLGVLPAVDEHLRWLPVDLVAQSMVEVVDNFTLEGQTSPTFFNLTNPRTLHWTQALVPYLRNAGLQFEIIDPPQWVARLLSMPDPVTNPAIKLSDYFVRNYNSTAPRPAVDFEIENMCKISQTFASIAAPDQVLITKIVQYLRTTSWSSPIRNTDEIPKSVIVVSGTPSTAEIAHNLAVSLSNRIKLSCQTGYSWLWARVGCGCDADTAAPTPLIDAGVLSRSDRDLFRCTGVQVTFLVVQAVKDTESPGDDEVDLIPLDGVTEPQALIETALDLAEEVTRRRA